MIKLVLNSVLVFFILIKPSLAYIGPGIAAGMLGATVGVVVTIVSVIFWLLGFPLKKLSNKIKYKRKLKK